MKHGKPHTGKFVAYYRVSTQRQGQHWESLAMKAALICSFLLTFSTLAYCQGMVYRWVDEDGVTVYSEKPPLDGRVSERISLPRTAEPGKESRQDWEQVHKYFQDKRMSREVAEQAAEQQSMIEKARRNNCEAGKSNLQNLIALADRRWHDKQAEPEYQRLREEERQAKMQESRERIAENCT